MSSNVKKFRTERDYKRYLSEDGWGYPSICLVGGKIHYCDELIMRWSEKDLIKTPRILGTMSHDAFKTWVETEALPCEMKYDGTEFNYLKQEDLTKLQNGSPSHLGNEDYLQLVEIPRVNIGIFRDTINQTIEVRFNFNNGCPQKFRKWFNGTWNNTRKCYTKLFGRYDSTISEDGTRIVCTSGKSCSEPWSAKMINDLMKATNPNLVEETYWEHIVLTYLFSAYYKTFLHHEIFEGINTWDNFTNGTTDSLGAANGFRNDGDQPYRFMNIENAIHGYKNLWVTGWNSKGDSYRVKFKEEHMTEDLNSAYIYPDVSGKITFGATYISNIDTLGIPTEFGGSSSTGFGVGACMKENPDIIGIALVGGESNSVYGQGGFCINNMTDLEAVGNIRARLTVLR